MRFSQGLKKPKDMQIFESVRVILFQNVCHRISLKDTFSKFTLVASQGQF